jgi:hypothetical protein
LSTPQQGRLVRTVTDERGRPIEVREDFVYDPVSRIMTQDWRLVDPDSPEPPAATIRYNQRQYFATDLERMLGAAGLAIKERFGDFDRSPFTSESKKQIIVCTAQD